MRFTIFSILFLLLFIYTIARNEQFSTIVITRATNVIPFSLLSCLLFCFRIFSPPLFFSFPFFREFILFPLFLLLFSLFLLAFLFALFSLFWLLKYFYFRRLFLRKVYFILNVLLPQKFFLSYSITNSSFLSTTFFFFCFVVCVK
jgi:hypothetical protein